MSKLSVFNFITLDGYFEGPEKGNINWHKHGKEENEFASERLQSENILLLGRITYEMMVGYWAIGLHQWLWRMILPLLKI
ncbi:MAG: hypothetical protein ABIR03_02970 [Ginsengibacter sp.]